MWERLIQGHQKAAYLLRLAAILVGWAAIQLSLYYHCAYARVHIFIFTLCINMLFCFNRDTRRISQSIKLQINMELFKLLVRVMRRCCCESAIQMKFNLIWFENITLFCKNVSGAVLLPQTACLNVFQLCAEAPFILYVASCSVWDSIAVTFAAFVVLLCILYFYSSDLILLHLPHFKFFSFFFFLAFLNLTTLRCKSSLQGPNNLL